MSDFQLLGSVPSSPDPDTVTLVAALLRHLLTLLSGAGILGGLAINDGMVLTISSALVGIGTIVWSLYQKFQAKRKDHLGNEMSAELSAGLGKPKPVQPA